MNIKKIVVLASLSILSLPSFAEAGSVEHSGQASKHSVLAITDGVGSITKVSSAVVASPVLVVGGLSLAAGSAVNSAGESLANNAQNVSGHHHGHNKALVITEITITADPAPNVVMQTPTVKKDEKIITHTSEETTVKTKKTTITEAEH
ncbi:hypothetical protein [Glaciecola petra]|uniref:Uncharacterized protein n=1 Tax=Glaciecola petra TaxID=3075602 RepID=A0ABU2ZUI3_9ALTE|nr:hypothetical protein [Aestuariibacter sp. P117]MDT0596295.1 hypothetical protein [Aestuariibacter sp. P117]